MIISAELIPLWFNLVTSPFIVACLTGALLTADWHALVNVTERQHVLFGGMFALLCLWLLDVQVVEGVWIHLLGVTSMTLIVGWRFTILSATVVLIVHTALIDQQPRTLAFAFLFTVLIPATTTRLLVLVLRRYGMKNLFVYMLGAGFGGGLVSVLLVASIVLPVLWLIGQDQWVSDALDNWPFIFLLLFPEGFINGMLVTSLTVFHPNLVKTFDDSFYLSN